MQYFCMERFNKHSGVIWYLWWNFIGKRNGYFFGRWRTGIWWIRKMEFGVRREHSGKCHHGKWSVMEESRDSSESGKPKFWSNTKRFDKNLRWEGKSFWVVEDTTKIKGLFLGCYSPSLLKRISSRDSRSYTRYFLYSLLPFKKKFKTFLENTRVFSTHKVNT